MDCDEGPMAAYPISANDLSAAPVDSRSRAAGVNAPVTCGACGCRLEATAARDGSIVYRHFGGASGRDARGCSVACTGDDHDAQGETLH